MCETYIVALSTRIPGVVYCFSAMDLMDVVRSHSLTGIVYPIAWELPDCVTGVQCMADDFPAFEKHLKKTWEMRRMFVDLPTYVSHLCLSSSGSKR